MSERKMELGHQHPASNYNVSKSDISKVLREPIINPNFDFSALPKLKCTGKLVILVATAPDHFSLRAAIRQTWGSSANTNRPSTEQGEAALAMTQSPRRLPQPRAATETNNPDFSLIFFIGTIAKTSTPETTSLLRRLTAEVLHFGDIVVSNFTDTYGNLSLKTVSMLQWVATFCGGETLYILKCDDDSYINVPLLLKALDAADAKPWNSTGRHFVIGYSFDKRQLEPIRSHDSKYFISYAEYSGFYFPASVSGVAYGMRLDTAALLYQVALRTPFFRLEDIYLVGMCGRRAGIQVVGDTRFTITRHLRRCRQGRYISGHDYSPRHLAYVYKALNNPGQCPIRIH